jgi:hypothetical protein
MHVPIVLLGYRWPMPLAGGCGSISSTDNVCSTVPCKHLCTASLAQTSIAWACQMLLVVCWRLFVVVRACGVFEGFVLVVLAQHTAQRNRCVRARRSWLAFRKPVPGPNLVSVQLNPVGLSDIVASRMPGSSLPACGSRSQRYWL